jgi:hypothetical protein
MSFTISCWVGSQAEAEDMASRHAREKAELEGALRQALEELSHSNQVLSRSTLCLHIILPLIKTLNYSLKHECPPLWLSQVK